MAPWPKFLLGLAAALAAGWIVHGPLGTGAALTAALESQATAIVARTEVPNISVAVERAPLSRAIALTGDANNFQREGQGEYPGITERVAAIPGVAAVRWTDDRAAAGFTPPLLAEALGMVGAAYLLGFGIGWFFFGRVKRDGYY